MPGSVGSWHRLSFLPVGMVDLAKPHSQSSKQALCTTHWSVSARGRHRDGLDVAEGLFRASVICPNPSWIPWQSFLLLMTPKMSALKTKKQCMCCFIALGHSHRFITEKATRLTPKTMRWKWVKGRRKWPDGRTVKVPNYNKHLSPASTPKTGGQPAL